LTDHSAEQEIPGLILLINTVLEDWNAVMYSPMIGIEEKKLLLSRIVDKIIVAKKKKKMSNKHEVDVRLRDPFTLKN
jgi:hypothetical protein